jgi:hypothetical protein
MFADQVKVTGKVTIIRWNEFGEETLRQEIDNLVVTTGKQWIAQRLTSSPPAVISHMAIGAPSSSVVPLITDTTLATEIARVAIDTAGGTASSNVTTFTAIFPAGTGTSANISEAGLFNASSSGTMACRTTFFPFSKGALDVIGMSWSLTIN